MANDQEAQLVLDELRATLTQLQKCGVPIKISTDAQGKPALWIGLGGVSVERGAFVFDAAKVMELQK
jgi:hypothetical protein